MRGDSPEDLKHLTDYLRRSVQLGESGIDRVVPLENVTALLYFFWREDIAAEKWPEFEGALLATWRNCGCLKTVVVTNAPHACVAAFAHRFSHVEVQVEELLVPGDITTMSYDCNSKLYERFSTDFVLIVQNDGFPLRPGLDEFVRKGYDFIGAPHCRPGFIPNLETRLANYCPSNGGFAMRSRKLCLLGSKLWEEGKFANREYVDDVMAEDYFYTKTLPRSSLKYWLSRRQAPSRISDYFSYGATFPFSARKMPFGFHSAAAFAELQRRYRGFCSV